MANEIDTQGSFRHQPIQARAANRIESLLDAAANKIDESGYETLTTQSVADGAGASIGTVYRYFPDRLSVIRSLAERNVAKLLVELDKVFAEQRESWRDYLASGQDVLAALYADEPGFRQVRTGDHVEYGEHVEKFGLPDQLADRIWNRYVEQFGVRDTVGNREAVRLGVRILVSLTDMSFAMSKQGEPDLLRAALRHAEQEIEPIF